MLTEKVSVYFFSGLGPLARSRTRLAQARRAAGAAPQAFAAAGGAGTLPNANDRLIPRFTEKKLGPNPIISRNQFLTRLRTQIKISKTRLSQIFRISLRSRKRRSFSEQSVAVRVASGDDIERPATRVNDERIQIHLQLRKNQRSSDKEVCTGNERNARILMRQIVCIGRKTIPDRTKDAVSIRLAFAACRNSQRPRSPCSSVFSRRQRTGSR